MCRCGKWVLKLTSYYKNGIRVTICDECAKTNGVFNDDSIIKEDYEAIKKVKQSIDTRERIF